MDTKQFHRRVWIMLLLLSLMLLGMGATLYDLQIVHGKDFYQQTQHRIAETEKVEAARGQLLDRNGRVLVSNRVVYQVTLDLDHMGDEGNDPASVLLSLIQTAREDGVTWNDSLPISKSAPFGFTTPEPYMTQTVGEDGTVTKSLTRLGRLAVNMGWVKKDPTKEPEATPAASPKKEGFWDKLKSFFTGTPTPEPSDAVPEPPQQPDTLPVAYELLGKMCASFKIKGDGAVDEAQAKREGLSVPTLNIGDMAPEDARAVAGVFYELYLRSRDVYRTAYIFAEDVDIDFISRVKELSLPGVIIEATTVRQYHTTYAAHLLGRVGLMDEQEIKYYTALDEDGDGAPDYERDDSVGKEGAEKAFESRLRGTSGVRELERNTSGKIVSQTWQLEPEPGDNVVLTLDIDLQKKIEDTLAASLPNLESDEVEGAACVVLDVNSAEVLAAASYPTFDLSRYSADFAENSADPLHPLSNRAFQGQYPPGSTFKMVTAVAGLEEKIITPSTRIRDEGRYTFYGSTGAPQCWIYRQYHRTHGSVNVSKAIEVSCNYFFYDVGRQLGIDRLSDYAARFGLGQKTGVELTESQGVMAGPAYTESVGGKWYEGSTLSVAIGQESSQFTPVQLANYIATLVNGGTRNAVHLLKEVKSNDFSKILYTAQPEALSTIDIAPENLAAVKSGMLSLTTDGSVRRYFANLDVQVGAKTGSAQISAQTESNAVFVCFAPYEDPEIAMAIVVEHGGSGSELGAMAADILSYYFSAQETREEILTENTLIR